MRDKSALLVTLAGLSDDDPRIDAVAEAMAGRREPERPSFRLFRVSEAARETGLSRCTIWRAIRDQRLKAVEIREGSHRIPEAELRRFVGGKA